MGIGRPPPLSLAEERESFKNGDLGGNKGQNDPFSFHVLSRDHGGLVCKVLDVNGIFPMLFQEPHLSTF